MSIYLATIEKLKQTQEVVDVYRDHLTDESLTGVINDYSEVLVYLGLFSDMGTPNGIAIVFLEDVTRIRWDGNSRQSVRQLVVAKASEPLAPPLMLDSLRAAVESVQKTFGYVNLLAERMQSDMAFIGEVEQIDDDALVLMGYGTLSSRDSSTMLIKLEHVTRIDAEAPYEQSIRFLARNPV